MRCVGWCWPVAIVLFLVAPDASPAVCNNWRSWIFGAHASHPPDHPVHTCHLPGKCPQRPPQQAMNQLRKLMDSELRYHPSTLLLEHQHTPSAAATCRCPLPLALHSPSSAAQCFRRSTYWWHSGTATLSLSLFAAARRSQPGISPAPYRPTSSRSADDRWHSTSGTRTVGCLLGRSCYK